MLSEQEKISLIAQISLDINQVKDVDILLEKILTNARKFFNADAGSIYLKDENELRFSYTQNDSLQSRLGPGKRLIYSTLSIPCDNLSIAGYVAKNCKTLNIPDVHRIRTNLPYRFDSKFDKLSDYKTRSMLTVPMTNQNGEVLGAMQIINAQDDLGNTIPFSKSDESLIMHLASSAALALERAQMTRNMILRMISMAELRDPMETGPHVNRVGAYSIEIFEEWAREKKLDLENVERQKDLLRMAAMLHDVGKVAISDLILRKPARLDTDEYEVIKSHTFLGARLFEGIQADFEKVAAEVALNHHERWDGTGYPGHIDPVSERALPGFEGPDGQPLPKREHEIPFFGRIVAVADVYDALGSRRYYKEPWDEDRILDTMHQLSGKYFDPEIMCSFFSCFDVLKSIALRYPEAGAEYPPS